MHFLTLGKHYMQDHAGAAQVIPDEALFSALLKSTNAKSQTTLTTFSKHNVTVILR